MTQLFRHDALAHRHIDSIGKIVLIRPISFLFYTIFSGMLALMIIVFFIFGTYTKRSTVSGQLIPDRGVIKMYAPQTGIVLEKRVVEGQQVERGDILLVVSSDHQSSAQGNIQEIISRQVEERRQSLSDELEKTRLLNKAQYQAMVAKVASLENELPKLTGQIGGQAARVRLAEESVARYQGLLTQSFISRQQLQVKQEELLDQKERFQSLEREFIAVNRELSFQRSELPNLSLRQQNQLAQIERGIASTRQDLVESEAKRESIVKASTSGIATAANVEPGQTVDAGRPLVSIVPRGAELQAHLYAPSKTIGFVKPGDIVLLRYQAFPYQKFGHAKGRVITVSKTALSASEISGYATLAGNQSGSEPLYQIKVALASQSIRANGIEQRLQAGMVLDADILQEERRLYEWVLDPLYSLTGKF